MIRAPMMANWIHQIGYDVASLTRRRRCHARRHDTMRSLAFEVEPEHGDHAGGGQKTNSGMPNLWTCVRPVPIARRHIEGATWSIRPRFEGLGLSAEKPVVTDHLPMTALPRSRCSGLVNWASRMSNSYPTMRLRGGKQFLRSSPHRHEPSDADGIELVYHWQHRNNPNGGDPLQRHMPISIGK